MLKSMIGQGMDMKRPGDDNPQYFKRMKPAPGIKKPNAGAASDTHKATPVSQHQVLVKKFNRKVIKKNK